MNENWKDIIGFGGKYMISDKGRVKSLSRIIGNGSGYLKPERILPFYKDTDGYHMVHLCKTGRKHTSKKIHRLVAIHFINTKLSSEQIVCHKDGDISNNALTNLYIGDVLTNTLDRYRHGSTRLSENDVKQIRSLLGKETQYKIAKMFNVKQSYISRIKTGIRAITVK